MRKKMTRYVASLVGVALIASTMPAALGNGSKGQHADEPHGDHGGHWMAPAEAAARTNPVAATPESIEQGKQVFANNCVTCHGANGEGDGPLAQGLSPKPTNLAAMAGQHTDGDFAWKVAHGRGAMPAWKEMLSEQDIWHVVNYIKSLETGTSMDASQSKAGEDHQHEPGQGHSDHKH